MSQLKTNSITNIGNQGDDNITLNSDGSTVVQDLTANDVTANDVTANDVTANDVTADDVTATSYNTGQLAGFRNQLINGSLSVWQRGTSFSSIGYTADRMLLANVGTGGGAATRDTNAPAASGLTYTINLNAGAILVQSCELYPTGQATQFAQGTTWTFSFYSRTAPRMSTDNKIEFATGNLSATDSVAIAENFTWQAEDVPGVSDFKRYSHTFTIGVDPVAGNNCIRMWARCDGASSVTGYQLEPGPVATPFEHRPIGTELALCERYYQLIPRVDLFCATPNSTQYLTANVNFRTAMRIRPIWLVGQYIRVTNTSFTNDNNYGLTISAETTQQDQSSYAVNISLDAEF